MNRLNEMFEPINVPIIDSGEPVPPGWARVVVPLKQVRPSVPQGWMLEREIGPLAKFPFGPVWAT